MLLSSLELRHSSEANDYRAEQNRLTEVANEFRDKANRLSVENIALQQETLKLQVRVYELQEGIEKKLTKIRLYARVHVAGNKMQLLVSNLSEFDLWINQVELVVTEVANGNTDSRATIGGANRISRGYTEDGYTLYGALVSINGNRSDRMNMKFHVKVVVTGVEDAPVTIKSPEYQFTFMSGQGKPMELKVLKYEP